MDGTERMVAWLLWKLCHLTFDRYSEVLRPFELALRDFVYNLLDNGLPLDWREKLAAYLDEWAAKGAEFGPQERYDLALYVESRAVLEGRLPRDPNAIRAPTAFEIEAERSRREVHEGLATAPMFPLDPSKPYQIPEYEWWKYPEQKAPIASIEERKGLGAWYDEAVATGQHDPGFFERTAVSIVRSFFPDSEPTRVITRTDGKVEVTISAGPTSGALAQQALAIGGLGSAVAGSRVAKEVVETVVDTAVQEATGSPVGPSVLRKPGSSGDGSNPKRPPKTPPSDDGSNPKRPPGVPPSDDVPNPKRPPPRQIEHLRRRPVEEANAEHIAKGHYPPYHPRVDVREFTTASELKFVRVYANKKNRPGSWMVREDAIAGMSPTEIKQALGLEKVPVYIADVTVPKDTPMRVSLVGEQPQWGVTGRGVAQYEVLKRLPDTSFTNERKL